MKKTSTFKLVITALFAALICVATMLIQIPIPATGGYANLGDGIILICAFLLPPAYAVTAAGLGSAIYDMLNPLYISEAWITFLTKGIYGLFPGLVMLLWKNHWGVIKAGIAASAGAVAYAAAYLAKTYYWSGIFKQGLAPEAAMLTVISKIPATVFNAAVAIIFAPILAVAIRKALVRDHLSLN